MKNLKISAKLILGFAIVALIAATIGVVGIVSLKTIDNSYSIAYTQQSQPLQYISKVIENLQRLRVDLRNFALYTGDVAHIKTLNDTVAADIAAFESNLATYDATIVNPEARKLFDEAKNLYSGSFKPVLLDVQQKSNKNVSTAELRSVLDETTSVTNQMVDNFERCMEIKVTAGETNSDENTATANMVLVIMIVIVIVGIIVAMLLGVYISSIISKPVRFTKDILYKMGMKGIVNFSDAEYKQAEEYARFNDEVAESIKMLIATARRLETVGRSLETVAGGDLTAEISLLSENDTMGVSLQAMLDNLNKMFSEINTASNQVSTGSVQIADGAQLLAQGATEQSATVEELSASVTEVSTQTKVNAGMAVDTKTLGEEIKKSAEKGNTQMNQMMQAVREISDASQNISKVIKIIDDIAFQTNILALNAAVEAARAGQHGKGFAVVADEVRSLAAKSAEAAKNTGGLIASAVEKAELGARISQETSESLRQIVDGIMKSSELVSQIASSSEDQANAINQISVGIDQVSQVIQQNSATAEESAAASEEMSGQATLLQQLIAQFKLRGGKSSGGGLTGRPASSSGYTPKAPVSVSTQSTGYSISGDKY